MTWKWLCTPEPSSSPAGYRFTSPIRDVDSKRPGPPAEQGGIKDVADGIIGDFIDCGRSSLSHV